MRTMFTLGFAPQQTVFNFSPPNFLGQTVAMVSMAKDTRDKLLADINRAAEEYKGITAWKGSTVNWQQLLGGDLLKFNQDLSNADSVAGNALSVQQKLTPNTPGWEVTEQEWDDSNTFVLMLDDATKLAKAHGGIPTVGAGMPTKASTVSPLAIGVGAAAAVGLAAVLFA